MNRLVLFMLICSRDTRAGRQQWLYDEVFTRNISIYL